MSGDVIPTIFSTDHDPIQLFVDWIWERQREIRTDLINFVTPECLRSSRVPPWQSICFSRGEYTAYNSVGIQVRNPFKHNDLDHRTTRRAWWEHWLKEFEEELEDVGHKLAHTETFRETDVSREEVEWYVDLGRRSALVVIVSRLKEGLDNEL